MVRLNRERRNRSMNNQSNSQNVSSVSSFREDMAKLGDAIVAGMSRAVNEKNDDDATISSQQVSAASNHSSSRPVASSGSVGEFIANLRKRKDHPN